MIALVGYIFLTLSSLETKAATETTLEPAPENDIQCSASIFSTSNKIPIDDIQPFHFVLPKNEESNSWKTNFESLELVDHYKSFFSPYWIAQDKLSKFSTKAILSRKPVTNGGIEFQLTRFPQTEKRVAGISLTINVALGYLASYLIDFKNDGYSKKTLSKIKIENDDAYVVVSCEVTPIEAQ
jgi:hypothetical protein